MRNPKRRQFAFSLYPRSTNLRFYRSEPASFHSVFRRLLANRPTPPSPRPSSINVQLDGNGVALTPSLIPTF